MERRLALVASVAGSVALVSGAIMTGVLLSQDPEPHESPEMAISPVDTDSSTLTAQDPVVVYQDEVEFVTVPGGAAPTVPPSPGAAAPAPEAGPSGPAVVAPTPAPAAVAPVPAPAPNTAPAPSTTTTLPPGVPKDWPAGKPIPPMPEGCRQPQLEDNGVWNCQH